MLEDAAALPAPSRVQMRPFVIAWLCCTVFYFLEYAIRSAPAVMIPELAQNFGVSTMGVSTIVGTYYYTYAATSLAAGVLLDHYGAKYVIPAGTFILACGCVVFALPYPIAGDIGRLLQGAGSAFAFTGAVYLAAHGLPAQRLATAIGVTQCLGMLGGSVGQIGVGPLIKGGMTVPAFWYLSGLLVLVVALLLVIITPKEQRVETTAFTASSILAPYKVVFSNPQSYLCGVVAGLLFAPTTIGDMIWGVAAFQRDLQFSYHNAVVIASMVPLGWVFGCPLLGWLSDRIGRRKPVIVGSAAVMMLAGAQIAFHPLPISAKLGMFIFGVASGAAMIPYSIIKEVNPDNVKGSATGGINFLVFAITAFLCPVYAHRIGRGTGNTPNLAVHFQRGAMFWIACCAIAIVVSFFLRETGRAAQPQPAPK